MHHYSRLQAAERRFIMPLKSEAAEREYQRLYKRMKRAGIPGTPVTLEKDINNAGAVHEKLIILEKQIAELQKEVMSLKHEQQTTELENSLKDKQG